MISIRPLPALKDNYIWIIIDEQQHTALIVDPGEAAPVTDYLAQHGLTLSGILITHHHWDHTNGIKELIADYHVPVFGPCKKNVPLITTVVQGGSKISIKNFSIDFEVLSIPGHTLDHIAYVADDILFSGDTLFSAGCGKIFEGTPLQMYTSLMKLHALADTTKIYCGHEYTLSNLHFAETLEPGNKYIAERIVQVKELRNKNLPTLPSLLAEEKLTNPFLRCQSAELISNMEKYVGRQLNGPIEIFTELRKRKNDFK